MIDKSPHVSSLEESVKLNVIVSLTSIALESNCSNTPWAIVSPGYLFVFSFEFSLEFSFEVSSNFFVFLVIESLSSNLNGAGCTVKFLEK